MNGGGRKNMTVLHYQKQEIDDYIRMNREYCNALAPEKLTSFIRSETNWLERGRCASGEEIGINVQVGDVCYLDYGRAYLNEAGYQHFGLVMAVYSHKAWVVSMSSNRTTFSKAYDPLSNPNGKINLYRLGKLPGMNRESVLFLNDAKFINTARVIRVMAHLDRTDPRFTEIQERLKTMLFQS